MRPFSFFRHYIVAAIMGAFFAASFANALAISTPQDVLPTAPQVFQNLDDVNNTQSLTGDQNGVNRNLLNEGPKRILDLIFGTFATVGTIICVIAGIRIIFSDGDSKKFQEGIKAIVYTVVGIMIIGGAWMIVRAILSINPGN